MKKLLILALVFISSLVLAGVDTGYIYVVENSSFKRAYYKIGMTRQADPMVRIKQLYTTSVAKPFTVKMLAYSDSVKADERRIHKELAPYRIDKRREFFKKDYRTIRKIIEKNITKKAS